MWVLQVGSTLVSEIPCVKEVNHRTRVPAVVLLKGLAHAKDTTYLAPLPSLGANTGEHIIDFIPGWQLNVML